MKNGISLEEQCLTIEQAKELQKLGVDFSNANLAFVNVIEPLKSIIKSEITKYYTELKDDLIPTLTNSEMLEMLPKSLIYKYNEYGLGVCRDIDTWNIYYSNGDYLTINGNRCVEIAALQRDALFEMLKYLKTNKLM